VPSAASTAIAPSPAAPLPTRRPIVQPSAPERYRVQFTIGPEAHEKLRRLQALLRREFPDGDPGAIFDRALTVLLEKVEKTKLAITAKPRPRRSIRPGTDKEVRQPASRDVPRAIKRAVWRRDAGQCAFVAPSGRRCTERTFLEFHHIQAHAHQGPATVANISLRCWRHNQYEAELIFGPHGASIVRDGRASYRRVGDSADHRDPLFTDCSRCGGSLPDPISATGTRRSPERSGRCPPGTSRGPGWTAAPRSGRSARRASGPPRSPPAGRSGRGSPSPRR